MQFQGVYGEHLHLTAKQLPSLFPSTQMMPLPPIMTKQEKTDRPQQQLAHNLQDLRASFLNFSVGFHTSPPC